MILACSPEFAPKLSEEEKIRRKTLREALRPGLVLEYVSTDYHEEDETPPGFHEVGDRLELLRIVEVCSIIVAATLEKSGEYNVWLVKSDRWGEREKDEIYLAAMTKIEEVPK